MNLDIPISAYKAKISEVFAGNIWFYDLVMFLESN